MLIKEINKKKGTPIAKEKAEELVKKLKKEHEKPMKGMFEFVDAQGGYLDFVYRFFKDDPIYTIRLVHGEICDIPAGIVKHLRNTKRKIRKISPQISENVRGVPSTVEYQSRVTFTPVDI